MRPRACSAGLCVLLLAACQLHATVIGASTAAESITPARIAKLPASQRQAWLDYLQRSERQMALDKAALAAERKGLATIPPLPKEGVGARSMPLHRDPAWYATPEARHVADVIVSFQTPAGGWSKNFSMAGDPRLPGQSYTTDNLSKYLGPDDFDAPRDANWNYVGTLDNDATTTELSFLALVAAQTPGADPYRKAFTRGIEYLLAAQFPNGGWPQVWPLEGGYHDAITFNDNAVTEAAAVLTEVAGHRFPWVGDELCRRAANAASRALGSILATQVEVHGKLTLWAQQHDALTLAPVSGRNFEPPALATGESADILLYLMGLPHPGKDVAAAIAAGIATLKSSAVYGQDWPAGRPAEGGRRLTPKPGAGPIWPRYLSLTTLKPIFGDRDKTIHDDVNELSLERRNGYSWYSAGPQRALDAYAAWTGTHPLP